MLICNLLIPLMLLFFGISFSKKGPEAINPLFGYRSDMSMKNRDTWDFAHSFCGRIWKRSAAVLLPLTVILMLLLYGRDAEFIGYVSIALMAVQLLPLILAVILTERALKKAFDENGLRK